MEVIEGFKAFNLDQTNIHGKKFEEGKTYVTKQPIQFYQGGYHICTHLAHVYSYYYPAEAVKVASVQGFGHKHYLAEDDYRGVYDMYAVEKITIKHFLTREEIIANILADIPYNQKIFINNAHLAEEELKLFISQLHDNFEMMRLLLYYQMGYENIYKEDYEDVQKLIRKCYHG